MAGEMPDPYLDKATNSAREELASARTVSDVEAIRVKYLGKSGGSRSACGR